MPQQFMPQFYPKIWTARLISNQRSRLSSLETFYLQIRLVFHRPSLSGSQLLLLLSSFDKQIRIMSLHRFWRIQSRAFSLLVWYSSSLSLSLSVLWSETGFVIISIETITFIVLFITFIIAIEIIPNPLSWEQFEN